MELLDRSRTAAALLGGALSAPPGHVEPGMVHDPAPCSAPMPARLMRIVCVLLTRWTETSGLRQSHSRPLRLPTQSLGVRANRAIPSIRSLPVPDPPFTRQANAHDGLGKPSDVARGLHQALLNQALHEPDGLRVSVHAGHVPRPGHMTTDSLDQGPLFLGHRKSNAATTMRKPFISPGDLIYRRCRDAVRTAFSNSITCGAEFPFRRLF